MVNDYLKNQQRKFEDYTEKYRCETNEVFRELTRQLILVATVFLSISIFVFNARDLNVRFNIFDRHFLAFAWIFLAFSIIFGIIQFFIDYLYFRKWTKAKFNIVEKIYTGDATEENLSQIVLESQKNIPFESSTVFVYLQSIFLIFGIIILISIMVKFLFSL